jgi:hypothetical protein
MPGLKQHYIPQFLLRGFGRGVRQERPGDGVLAHARDVPDGDPRDQGAARFLTPTTRSRAETLDDRITAHESRWEWGW